MKLFDLRTEYIDDSIVLTITIESEELGIKELWFSTPNEYTEAVAIDRYDAFLVGMLYPAMKYGENINIKGTVSRKLLFNINHYAIPLIQSFSPSCKRIQVKADQVTDEIYQGQGVGTGFSGGIDSFCTIYDHFEMEQDPSYKINSFIFLNVGAHGSEDENKVREKFHTRYEYLKHFPEELGLYFMPVDSNLHLFHPWGHQSTHTLTSVSGILFMQQFYKRYYYASAGLDYEFAIKTAPKYRDIDIGAYCDPILLPLLSTESIELIADGTQYTRAEKTIRISNYEPVKKYLNVCVSGDDTHENCSVCGKCCRTLMTLNSTGKIDEFKHLFDLKKYKEQAEIKYICDQVVNYNKDAFAKANVDLAKENRIKLPNKAFCFLKASPDILKRKLIKFAKGNLSESSQKKIRKIIKE